jgi:hypothetical protein
MDTEPLIVACSACRLVSSFLPRDLEEIETEMGVAPYNPDAPMRVFPVPIECDDLGCKFQVVALVVLSANTSPAELQEEKKKWRSQKRDFSKWLNEIGSF